jgi:hypothetical protein
MPKGKMAGLRGLTQKDNYYTGDACARQRAIVYLINR